MPASDDDDGPPRGGIERRRRRPRPPLRPSSLPALVCFSLWLIFGSLPHIEGGEGGEGGGWGRGGGQCSSFLFFGPVAGGCGGLCPPLSDRTSDRDSLSPATGGGRGPAWDDRGGPAASTPVGGPVVPPGAPLRSRSGGAGVPPAAPRAGGGGPFLFLVPLWGGAGGCAPRHPTERLTVTASLPQREEDAGATAAGGSIDVADVLYRRGACRLCPRHRLKHRISPAFEPPPQVAASSRLKPPPQAPASSCCLKPPPQAAVSSSLKPPPQAPASSRCRRHRCCPCRRCCCCEHGYGCRRCGDDGTGHYGHGCSHGLHYVARSPRRLLWQSACCVSPVSGPRGVGLCSSVRIVVVAVFWSS